MAMEKIDIRQVKEIAQKKGLRPGKVKGTDAIQITKGKNPKVEVITWEEFESILKRKKLAVYSSGGFMRIMGA